MPRAQVEPQKRKRALQACVPCKASKKRCDSGTPCTNCLKHNDGVACSYSNPEKPRLPGNVTSSILRTAVETTVDSPRVGVRMLWTSRGSRVYIGGSASLSFLHLLRDMLTRYMGPSAFTNDTGRSYMLETQRDRPLSPEDSTCQYGFNERVELVDTYLAATCGVMDVLDRTQIIQHLKLVRRGNNETTRDGVVYAIVAIGAQCRAAGVMDKRCEKSHVGQAQQIAFENMLEDPSIDMVRLFLALSFYMLGACRRNAAFMYIGVAARAAYVLGLHHDESYRSGTSEEKNSLLMTWKSIRILDLLVSSILGRPPATSEIESTPLPDSESDNDRHVHRRLCFDATFGIWSIVDQIVQKFYRKNDFDVSSATSFLTAIQSWSANLSVSVKKHSSTGSSRLQNQENAIGGLHVACSYYYAVMLATRKYLISQLASQLATSTHAYPENPNQDTSQASPERSKLAQTCTESAILTLQTCHEVSNAGLLLSNMCLLKAWIFGAALVLGFAMFTQENPDPETEAAFNQGNSVLSKLATNSPQAKHYFDILSNLHNAIKEHHQQRASLKKDRGRNTFVEKIFRMNDSPDNQEFQLMTNPNGSTINYGSTLDYPGLQWSSEPIESGTLANMDLANEASMAFDDIDSVAVQLWDEFVLGQNLNAAPWDP